MGVLAVGSAMFSLLLDETKDVQMDDGDQEHQLQKQLQQQKDGEQLQLEKQLPQQNVDEQLQQQKQLPEQNDGGIANTTFEQ